jgi:diacylglycerol kinase (ATP)
MHLAAILGPGDLVKPLAAFHKQTRQQPNSQWTSLIEQADVIVLFGGDGTLHHHLSTLVDLDVPVLVVPCGSGNDFARAIGLRTVQDSILAWHKFSGGEANVRTIDLGIIHHTTPAEGPAEAERIQRYFCSVAAVGLGGAVARRANSLPKWVRAHGGYGLAAPREFLRFVPFDMKISPDGSSAGKLQPIMLAAVANSPSFGGGMKIAPRAQLDDGKLDLCIVQAMDKVSLFRLFPTVYFGRHLDSGRVDYLQTPTATIETASPCDVFADGELVCQTPVEFSVAAKALQVIVPA